MKKLMYSVIILLMAASSTIAQNADNLTGKWKIEAFNLFGVYYELSTDKIELDASLSEEAPVTADDTSMLLEMVKAQVQPYLSNYFEFKNDTIIINYGGKTSEGKYKIIEKEGIKYIQISYSNGTLKEIAFILENNLLPYLIKKVK